MIFSNPVDAPASSWGTRHHCPMAVGAYDRSACRV